MRIVMQGLYSSIKGYFRVVVFLAQVGKNHMLQIFMNQFLEKSRRFHIIKMSLAGPYSLLQVRRIRPIL